MQLFALFQSATAAESTATGANPNQALEPLVGLEGESAFAALLAALQQPQAIEAVEEAVDADPIAALADAAAATADEEAAEANDEPPTVSIEGELAEAAPDAAVPADAAIPLPVADGADFESETAAAEREVAASTNEAIALAVPPTSAPAIARVQQAPTERPTPKNVGTPASTNLLASTEPPPLLPSVEFADSAQTATSFADLPQQPAEAFLDRWTQSVRNETATADPIATTAPDAASAADTATTVRPTAPVASQTPVQAAQPSAPSEPTAPQAPAPPPEPPVVRIEQVAAGSVRHVRLLSQNGERTMTVRLVPESLGEMHLEVRTQGDAIAVRFASSNASVREQLEAQAMAIRDALTRDGLQVSRIEVASNLAQSPQGDAAFDRQPQQGPSEHSRSPTQGSRRDADSNGAHREPRNARPESQRTPGPGTLDLIV